LKLPRWIQKIPDTGSPGSKGGPTLNDISNTTPANAAVGLIGEIRVLWLNAGLSCDGRAIYAPRRFTQAPRRFTQASLNKEPAWRGRRDQ
jgi:hypothetical protein